MTAFGFGSPRIRGGAVGRPGLRPVRTAAAAALLAALGGWAVPSQAAAPVATAATFAAAPPVAVTAVQYRRPYVAYHGPYWHAPLPPRTRWAFTYRGRGYGPLYAGPGPARRIVVVPEPAPREVVVVPEPFLVPDGVGVAAPAWPPRVAPPPPDGVPLAADPRDTIRLPRGSQPRTIVEVERGPPVPWTDAWYRACAERYRSFDPATGTFLGYDGRRRFCR